MKELSIEEKARAYDEALERVKKLLSRCTDNRYKRTKVYHIEDIESIFPELKDGEDEWIRKAILIGLIDCRDAPDMGWTNFGGVSINKCIDWLEKQGDQKQTWKPNAAQLIVIKDLIDDKNTSKVNKVILRGMFDEFKQFTEEIGL